MNNTLETYVFIHTSFTQIEQKFQTGLFIKLIVAKLMEGDFFFWFMIRYGSRHADVIILENPNIKLLILR